MALYAELRDNLDAVCCYLEDAKHTLEEIGAVYDGEVDDQLIDLLAAKIAEIEPTARAMFETSAQLYQLWDNSDDMSDLSALLFDAAGAQNAPAAGEYYEK